MSHVTIPATGSGDATPQVSTDLVSGAHYQYVKLADGTVGGSAPATVDAAGNLRVGIGSAGPGVWFGASVSNFPANQTVTISGQPISVSGNVTASVIGQVGASIANTPQVSIASYSVTQPISVASTSVTQPVSGGVTASVVGYLGASITNAGALSAASQVLVGGSTTVFVASQPAQVLVGYVGASITNYPANIGSATTFIASALPGILIGASVSNQSAAGAASQVVVGGSITIASMVPGLYLGASIANTPQVSIASYSVTQPVALASTSVTQPVSGGVTASTIGYVGASVAGGALTASVIGYVGASITNTPSVNSFNVGGSVISFPDAAPTGGGYGASPYHYVSGASVNQNLVKGAAGTLYNVVAMNQNVNQRYLKLFDKSSTPSPGTDIPRQTYMIPGASAGAGAVIPMPVGMLFGSGIGFAITANISDLDATAVGASDVVVNLAYS